jgi:hypothetical protein
MIETTELRLAMLANGFSPVPAQGKRVLLEGWSTKATAASSEIAAWGIEHPHWNNTGTLTSRTPTIDGDIRDQAAAEAFEELVRDWLDERGRILVRIGEAPKRAVLCRASEPFAKIKVDFVAPSGSTHKIEILGDGQQLVVARIHPDTHKPYTWHGGEPWTVQWSELPEINEAEAREFIARAAAMLEREFGFRRTGGAGERGNGHTQEAEFVASRAAVDVEQELADIHFGNIHDTWKRCMGSLLRAGVPANDVMRRLKQAAEQSPRCQDDPRKKLWAKALAEMMTWYVRSDPTFIANLEAKQQQDWQARLQEARAPRLVWRDDHGLQVRREYGADSQNSAENSDNSGTAKADEKSNKNQDSWWPTPYSGRAASQIPLRKFILGKHYLTGASSVTASAGGIGKSTLSLLDAVSFRVGRDLLTSEPLDKCRRVWVWNAEDDVDEMERRIAGICAHYGISLTEVRDGLFLNSGYDLPLDLAYGNGKGAHVNEPLINRISARVKELQIEVVMLDPLVALHSMSEGDNPGHAKLIRTLSTNLAKPCECAVDINTHTRKPGIGQDTLTVDDIRGPGAIVYSARSGRILNPMSPNEAEKYNIEAEERLSYYRLERAKANMAKRGTICWVRMIEVPIANRPDGSYGDVVAVPALWVPPDAMAGITETVANAIAGEIAKGNYKRDARAGATWAGRLVGLRCGIDTGTKSGKERVKAILETLIKKGVLAVEIRTDKNRNAREYVVPGVLHGPVK